MRSNDIGSFAPNAPDVKEGEANKEPRNGGVGRTPSEVGCGCDDRSRDEAGSTLLCNMRTKSHQEVKSMYLDQIS